MSVTPIHPSMRGHAGGSEWSQPTADLEPTTDLHEEHTSDLAPAESEAASAAAAEPAGDRPAPRSAPVRTSIIEPPPHRSNAAPVLAAARIGPGSVLEDRFLLEQVIGRGGTSIVYRARDMESSKGSDPNACIALKTPRPGSDERRAAMRLRHEFEHAQRLSHPNIVRVHELYDGAQPCFMTMELIEGRLLSTIVRDWTVLPAPLTQKILRGSAQALAHAHGRQVVHGDFKPSNVFVTRDEQVKVVDFGAAVATAAGVDTRVPAATPGYASPEVLDGQPPEARDDIFSFACVAYELLTGQHPFGNSSSLQAREQRKIPPRAWSLTPSQWLALVDALSWERAQRPSDIGALMSALTAEARHAPEITPVIAAVGAAQAVAAKELPRELMPARRGWGFFVFLACALAVTLIAVLSRRAALDRPQVQPAQPRAPAAQASPPQEPVTRESVAGPSAPPPPVAQTTVATAGTASAAPTRPSGSRAGKTKAAPPPVTFEPRQPPAEISELSFTSGTIVTSESAVAAVFLIERSQPWSGRVRVSWQALGGTAEAGVDFVANSAGTADFADGQAQRAIYVPLRNDLLKERNETFTVRLHSPERARLGPLVRVRATILDDD